jgi:hypothetical protein
MPLMRVAALATFAGAACAWWLLVYERNAARDGLRQAAQAERRMREVVCHWEPCPTGGKLWNEPPAS